MNKAQLIDEIVAKTGLKKKDVEATVTALINISSENLANGEKVQISGFGTFELKSKPARDGINPKTGEKIKIAESKIPAFKFGKAYKDSFN